MKNMTNIEFYLRYVLLAAVDIANEPETAIQFRYKKPALITGAEGVLIKS